jgi:hypothetical protein
MKQTNRYRYQPREFARKAGVTVRTLHHSSPTAWSMCAVPGNWFVLTCAANVDRVVGVSLGPAFLPPLSIKACLIVAPGQIICQADPPSR